MRLQHRVAVVAAPIGAGHLHQLEGGADIAGAAHVRAAAQVDPVALPVQRDGLAARQVADELDLVVLALLLEQRDRLVAGGDDALETRVPRDDLAHPRLDGGEILGGEGLVAGEVVVEAVLDRRADGHLRAGEQRLHRLGQHMGGVVADQVQRLGVAAGDEADGGIGLDRAREVLDRAIDLHGQRRLGQARADRLRDLGARDRPIEGPHGSVGQGDRGHCGGILAASCRMGRGKCVRGPCRVKAGRRHRPGSGRGAAARRVCAIAKCCFARRQA